MSRQQGQGGPGLNSVFSDTRWTSDESLFLMEMSFPLPTRGVPCCRTLWRQKCLWVQGKIDQALLWERAPGEAAERSPLRSPLISLLHQELFGQTPPLGF